MGIRNLFKSKRKKNRAAENGGADGVMSLSVDPSDIDPPETRYTDEYHDFIESQEPEDGNRSLPDDCESSDRASETADASDAEQLDADQFGAE